MQANHWDLYPHDFLNPATSEGEIATKTSGRYAELIPYFLWVNVLCSR